jgi:hypothetical protein
MILAENVKLGVVPLNAVMLTPTSTVVRAEIVSLARRVKIRLQLIGLKQNGTKARTYTVSHCSVTTAL